MNSKVLKPFMRGTLAATILATSLTTALLSPLMAMENNPPAGGGGAAGVAGAHAAAAPMHNVAHDEAGAAIAEQFIAKVQAHGMVSLEHPRHRGQPFVAEYLLDEHGIHDEAVFNAAVQNGPFFNRLRTTLSHPSRNGDAPPDVVDHLVRFYYEIVRELCVQILLHRNQEQGNADEPLERLVLDVLFVAQNAYGDNIPGEIRFPRDNSFLRQIQLSGLHPLPEAIRADVAARRGAHA